MNILKVIRSLYTVTECYTELKSWHKVSDISSHRSLLVHEKMTRPVGELMPHFDESRFAESQFAENPCRLLIFLKRKCRWHQTKLTLTVTLTLNGTVTVIFLRAFRWHP